MMTNFAATLLQEALAIVPRVLGEQDPNPLSATHGHFGRLHWAWKTHPMADAANQYAVAFLAAVWAARHPDNPYAGSQELYEAIRLGIACLRRLQRDDGSFDQVYPNERSFGATSYLVGAILDCEELLGAALDETIRADVDAVVSRSLPFLLSEDETYGVISNHLALFAWNFHRLALRTGSDACARRAEHYVQVILDHASPEGWFLEYEGADPGYQTQCLHYLALLLDIGRWDALDRAVEQAVRVFLPIFAHPDGSLGGHYGSRNTSIVYPGGFATLTDRHEMATSILRNHHRALVAGATPVPSALDLPNAIRLGRNYLMAWSRLVERSIDVDMEPTGLPWQEDSLWRVMPEGGFAAAARPAYYAVVGMRQGGVLKVYDKRTGALAYEDRGYIARERGGPVATHVHHGVAPRFNEWRVDADFNFRKVPQPAMRPWKYALLVLLGSTLFRARWGREAVKRLLVGALITRRPAISARCHRSIHFEEDRVVIRDELYCQFGRLAALEAPRGVGTVHMASANYRDPTPLLAVPTPPVDTVDDRTVRIETVITFNPPGVSRVGGIADAA